MKKQLPLPHAPGRASMAQGFQPTIQQVADQLGVEVHSLAARLDIGDIEGEPAAYQGVRVFEPETRSFLMDTSQDGASSNLVNYVVHDGQVYDIPILTPGPGVFVATGLSVAITQRRFDPAVGPMQINYNSLWNGLTAGRNWTTKFSLWPIQPYAGPAATNSPSVQMNFFWNLLDVRTGDLYSDQPLNHLTLRPRQLAVDTGSSVVGGSPYLDGGLFVSDTPWVFPYGAGAVFKFQPITPVVQFDSTLVGFAQTGINYDDRENGVRDQSVTVKAMLQGYRTMVAPGV